jgi:hypothetical protein
MDRGPERGPEAGPGLRPGESITKPLDEARLGSVEHKLTIEQAIREVQERTGATAFVSAGREAEGRARRIEPEALLESIQRASDRVAPGAAQRPTYTVGEGGSIVNTVTGRTEYLPVHSQGARDDLARKQAEGPGAQPAAAPLDARPAKEPEVAVDERIYAPRGGAPREVAKHSHYNDPISHPDGELSGNSRRYGDASRETQKACMDLIIAKGRERGMSDHEIALTLAIARTESGFNPDAAAGSTSAAGLGQMIDRTGKHYGLDAGNRWSAGAQADALVQHTQDNLAMARAKGHGGADLDRYTYAYHHDGPSLKYGGLQIADRNVVPNVELYERYVKTH